MKRRTIHIIQAELNTIWDKHKEFSLASFGKAFKRFVNERGIKTDKTLRISTDAESDYLFRIDGEALEPKKTEFIYLREQGVSFGVEVRADKAYLAASFVNSDDPVDGSKPDVFSKRGAKVRIQGRINKVAENGSHKFGVALDIREGVTAFDIAQKLRQQFLPDNEEDFSWFSVTVPTSSGDLTFRRARTNVVEDPEYQCAWDVIKEAFREAVK